MRKIDLIVVHCSATRSTQDVGAAVIKQWHTNPKYNKRKKTYTYMGRKYSKVGELPKAVRGASGNGWRDIGYHYVIKRDGSLETGRPLQTAGAHARGFNANSIGICIAGGIDSRGNPSSNFTDRQLSVLLRLIRFLQQMYDIPDTSVVGHRDLPNVAKSCPCFDVKQWLSSSILYS